MAKPKLPGQTPLNFQQKPSDVLSGLRAQLDQIKNAPRDAFAIQCFAIRAWHMTDEIWVATKPTPELSAFQGQMKEQCPSLAYMQDLATYGKHAELLHWKQRVDDTKNLDVFEEDVFEPGVYEEGWALEINGTERQVLEIAQEVLDFWEEYSSPQNR